MNGGKWLTILLVVLFFITLPYVNAAPPPVSHERLTTIQSDPIFYPLNNSLKTNFPTPDNITFGVQKQPSEKDPWQDPLNPNRPELNPNGTAICYAVFNPYLLALKRTFVVDSIREDYYPYISDRTMRPLQVSKATFKEVFEANLNLNLESGKYVLIPSVSPDAQIMDYSISPKVNIEFYKDGADNFYVKSDTTIKAKLYIKMGMNGDYFKSFIPEHLTLSDISTELLKEPPQIVKSKAQIIINELGLVNEKNLGRAVKTLTEYFSSFGCGTIPSGKIEPDIYLAISKYKQGACAARAFGFFITANSMGIPTRMVLNECHAFVEVHVPSYGWQRINLGGCGTSISKGIEGKQPHKSFSEGGSSDQSSGQVGVTNIPLAPEELIFSSREKKNPADRDWPDKVTCFAVFDPYLLGLKRTDVFDAIREDYSFYVSDKTITPLELSKRSFNEIFTGEINLNLETGKYISIPSPAPDAEIIEYSITPNVDVQFFKDGADNFYVKSNASLRAKLKYKMGTSGGYFRLYIPEYLTLEDIPREKIKEPPVKVKSATQLIINNLGLSNEKNLRAIVAELTDYFSGFGCDKTTVPTADSEPDTYLAIAKSKQGACGQRAFGFFVTANSMGLPTRYVRNECHAFVEVYIPGQGWKKINLGGCGSAERRNTEGKRPFSTSLDGGESKPGFSEGGAKSEAYKDKGGAIEPIKIQDPAKKDIRLYLTISPTYAIRGETAVDVSVEAKSGGNYVDGLKVRLKDLTENKDLGTVLTGASRKKSGGILKPTLLWKENFDREDVIGVGIAKDSDYIAVVSEMRLSGQSLLKVHLLNKEGQVVKNFYADEPISKSPHVAASVAGSFIVVESYPYIYLFRGGGPPSWTFMPGELTRSVDVSQDGRLIAVGAEDFVYLMDNNKHVLWKKDLKGPVNSVSISSSGDKIVAGGDGFYVFDKSGSLLVENKSKEAFSVVSISPEGEYVALGSTSRIYFLNGTGSKLWEYKIDGSVRDLALSSNGKYVIASSNDYVYLLDKKGGLLWKYAPEFTILGADLSPDGKYFAGAWGGDVFLFDTNVIIGGPVPTVEIASATASVGNHTILAEFSGDETYRSSTAYSHIFIASRTNISINLNSEKYRKNEIIQVSGELNDFIAPVVGKRVALEVNGVKIGEFKTDYKGNFNALINASDLGIGNFSIQGIFDSDDERYKSAKSSILEFQILNERLKSKKTILNIQVNSTKTIPGGMVLVNGTLKAEDEFLGTKKISIFVSGAEAGETVTDENGYFEAILPLPQEPGTYSVKASFTSDNPLIESSESNLLMISVVAKGIDWKVILAVTLITLLGLGGIVYYAVFKKKGRKVEVKKPAIVATQEKPEPIIPTEPGKIDPREGVISSYHQILSILNSKGILKAYNQTHWEFYSSASSRIPDLRESLYKITALYEEAFYSEHEIREKHYRDAIREATTIAGFFGGKNA